MENQKCNTCPSRTTQYVSNKTQKGELKNEDSKNYQSSTGRILF